MKKLIGLLLAGGMTVHCVFAQSSDKQPDIIPPSPEAGNLGKFAEIPISYNTGTPKIDVPLYDISVNDMHIPISLSYHAGGIKVEEVASWVGIGFVLNAGGVITRVMQGRPDESSLGYFNRAQWDHWQEIKDLILPNPRIGVNDAAGERQNFQIAVASGLVDLQPDIFYFNFAGYSGRIVFDIDKKPVIIPYQDLKISHPFTDENTEEWVISTPDGIEYVFKNADAERTDPLNEGSNQPSFYSAWYLSDVRSLKQPGFIHFNYISSRLEGIETIPNSGVVLGPRDQSDDLCSADPPYPQGMGSNEYSIAVKYLHSITFSNGSVQFSSTADREDKYQKVNYTGRKLNSFTVFGDGQYGVKTVDFEYTYVTNRLTLTSVKETGKGAYKFSYSGSLPDPDSFQQDEWGYFNGPNSNISLIPKLTPEEENLYEQNGLATANRDPNGAGGAGSLSSITYPTGGRRNFTFEPHDVYSFTTEFPGDEVSARGGILNPCMDFYEQRQYNYFYDQQYVIAGGPVNVRASTFTIDDTRYVNLDYGISVSGSGSAADVAQVHVYEIKNGVVDYGDPVTYNRKGAVLFDPGDYVMIAAASQPQVTAWGSYSFSKTVRKNIIVGGMRIAKIEDVDNGKTTSTLNFNYSLPSTSGVPTVPGSGGHGPHVPQEPDPNDPCAEPPLPPPALVRPSTGELFEFINMKTVTPCRRLYVSSRNVYHPNTFEGSHIGYKRVEVIQSVDERDEEGNLEDVTTKGSTVYIYNNNINDIMRGQPDQITYYDAYGNMVKQSLYRYNFQDVDPIFFSYATSIEMQKKKHWVYTVDGKIVVDYFDFRVTNKEYATFFPYQTKITENVFSKERYPQFATIITETSQGKEGSYNESHTQINEIIKTTSTNEKVVEKFVYSTDLGSPETPNVKVPIHHYVLKETGGQRQLVHATKTDYQANQPTRISYFETAEPILFADDMTLTYGKFQDLKYNTDRKLVQQSFSNGTKTSFIWDSKGLHPLAQISNCASDQAAYTSFENASNEGNWTFVLARDNDSKTGDESYVFSSGGISKSGLIPSQEYYVTYWAKNGVPAMNNVVRSYDDATAASDGWTFYFKVVSGSTAISITAPGGTRIDELRIFPRESAMTSLVYKSGIGITSQSDANGRLTFFDYDTANRLNYIRDHDRNPVQNYDYHYKN